LTDFCSRLHLTPAIRDFCDDDDNPDLCVSDQSSDIEEESELKKFTRALQEAQIIALKKENKNRRGTYSKKSKKTLKRRRQHRINLVAKGFHPVDEYMRLKNLTEKKNEDAPELDKIILQEESEEGSDEEIGLVQDTCTHSSISDASEVRSEESLPGTLSNVRLRLTHHARMESEESSEEDDGGGDGDKDMRTASKRLEDLRHDAVPAHQDISQYKPGSTSQLLGNRSRLREGCAQLTKEAKNGNLDVIVRACIAAMIGLLNIYTHN
jgi:hypothetical protein